MRLLTRSSSFLPQGSQVSHLCQWSVVHVGKKDSPNHQIPGDARLSKIKAGGGKTLSGDYSTFVCNRVTVCGTLPSLCSWLSCTDVTCSWLPCLGWWLPARCSSLGLWLATGLTAIPGTKVHVMVSLWFQKLHSTSVNRSLGASVSSWVMYSFFLLLVAHASLFIQNISVTVCSIVLMLVFLYKQRIEQIWDGWLTVSTPFPNGHVSSLGATLTREQRWNAQF